MKTISIELTEEQAIAYSQYLKRISFSDYRGLSQTEEEAYLAQEAGEAVRSSLAQNGYNPR